MVKKIHSPEWIKIMYIKTQITEVFQILLLIVARIRLTNTIFD